MKIGYAWLGAGMTLLAIGGAPAHGAARYHDGEFAGQAADTEWGAVQVKAVVHDGALTDVQFLQYPWHRRRSQEISRWSLPQLRDEAIHAQTARVDGRRAQPRGEIKTDWVAAVRVCAPSQRLARATSRAGFGCKEKTIPP
jgi:hypothetical protein